MIQFQALKTDFIRCWVFSPSFRAVQSAHKALKSKFPEILKLG